MSATICHKTNTDRPLWDIRTVWDALVVGCGGLSLASWLKHAMRRVDALVLPDSFATRTVTTDAETEGEQRERLTVTSRPAIVPCESTLVLPAKCHLAAHSATTEDGRRVSWAICYSNFTEKPASPKRPSMVVEPITSLGFSFQSAKHSTRSLR